jgi:hypothetical protein
VTSTFCAWKRPPGETMLAMERFMTAPIRIPDPTASRNWNMLA